MTVELINGDCVEVMAQMEPESVDACVTDPPYSLGFMNSAWDKTGVENDPETWRQVLRVLKPGGYLLSFGGTRTYHRLACAIEDAGFELRDCQMWLYGCLSEDTEILTVDGWKLGVDVIEGELVAQWDPMTEAISLAAIEQKFLAPWDGPMRSLRNSDMDQLVTPNHRVWHRTQSRKMTDGQRPSWYEESWKVDEASRITRSRPTRFPLAGYHHGPGLGGDDYAALLGWVWTEGGFDHTGTGVRIYQSETANPGDVKSIDSLLERMGIPFKRYARERTWRYKETERKATEICWFMSGEWAQRVRADLPGKHLSWELLFRLSQREKLAFYASAMAGDGTGGHALDQKHPGDLEWFATLCHLVGKRAWVTMRKNRDNGSVFVSQKARTEMQCRHFQASPDEHYTGLVWCVMVPTGAFLARRNGRVFITGNSGFPKSMDVSKAIDKQRDDKDDIRIICRWLRKAIDDSAYSVKAVAEHFGFDPRMVKHWAARDTDSQPSVPTLEQWDELRSLLCFGCEMDAEVLRLNLRKGEPGEAWSDRPITGVLQEWENRSNYALTARDGLRRDIPATPEAQQWQGWGTALKPAYEPIVVARKPLIGSVASNVLRFGTGGLNIDGCRVGNGGQLKWSEPRGMGYHGSTNSTAEPTTSQLGRWPANIVLSHVGGPHGCVKLGQSTAPGYQINRWSDGAKPFGNGAGHPYESEQQASQPVDVWECADGCAVKVLDEQSGKSHSQIGSQPNLGRRSGISSWSSNSHNAGTPMGYEDQGGASRYFNTFEPDFDPPFYYTAKASTAEREAGLHGFPQVKVADTVDGTPVDNPYQRGETLRLNCHPTVKPLELMRHLVRLVTPPGGTVLDPFLGSGTTGIAAVFEGMHFIGIEKDTEHGYMDIARARIAFAEKRLALGYTTFEDTAVRTPARGASLPSRVEQLDILEGLL